MRDPGQNGDKVPVFAAGCYLVPAVHGDEWLWIRHVPTVRARTALLLTSTHRLSKRRLVASRFFRKHDATKPMTPVECRLTRVGSSP